jgi:hypothetical protein
MAPETEREFDELLRTSAEQRLNLMHQTNQTSLELQQAFNELIAQQTRELAVQSRNNMQQIGQNVEQSAAEARRSVQQRAHAVQQASTCSKVPAPTAFPSRIRRIDNPVDMRALACPSARPITRSGACGHRDKRVIPTALTPLGINKTR